MALLQCAGNNLLTARLIAVSEGVLDALDGVKLSIDFVLNFVNGTERTGSKLFDCVMVKILLEARQLAGGRGGGCR